MPVDLMLHTENVVECGLNFMGIELKLSAVYFHDVPQVVIVNLLL